MTTRRFAFTAIAAVALLAACQPAAQDATDLPLIEAEELTPPPTASSSAAMVVGAPDAMIVIEEYSDYQCPFCAEQSLKHSEGVLQLIENREDIRFEFYDLALPGHHNASIAATAARCVASQGGDYQTAKNTIFGVQRNWALQEDPTPILVAELTPLAAGLEECIERSKAEVEEILRHNMDKAVAEGVSGTPTLIVRVGDAQQSLQGVASAKLIEKTITELLPN